MQGHHLHHLIQVLINTIANKLYSTEILIITKNKLLIIFDIFHVHLSLKESKDCQLKSLERFF